jgi:hypothetical protein
MKATKIVFSKEEFQVLYDTQIWQRKRNLNLKITNHLSNLHQTLKEEHEPRFLNLLGQHPSAKISRGENYLGNPYIILDYPNHFQKQNILAIRNIIWFGNYYSSHLLLSGSYLSLSNSIIAEARKIKDIYFTIHPNSWQHHFLKENVILLQKISDSQIHEHINYHTFFKLSLKCSLRNDWDRTSKKMYQLLKQY